MSQTEPIPRNYFDHNATSPLRPRVRQALREALEFGGWGNPSSVHASGRKASRMVEEAREKVARSLRGDPRRITFTSGATEANHAGITSLAREAKRQHRMVILASPLEHPSVLGCLVGLERQGFKIVWSELNDHGAPKDGSLEDLASLDKELGFAVCMAANNETGALQPWVRWARDGERLGIPVHIDGTQLWRKWSSPPDLPKLGNWVLSAHKQGALSGVGAIYSSGVSLEGWLGDGPQERTRRGGTENLLGILSLGEVSELPLDDHSQIDLTVIERTLGRIPGVKSSIPLTLRLPNTLHLRLPVRTDLVVQRLDLAGYAVSSGSACSSGSVKPSSVLLAMGWGPEEARQGLRISSGWTNTQEEVQELADALQEILEG